VPVAITENTSIDYDVGGEGPPLLLIGGLGFGRWAWFRQVPAFSRHFQTITPSTPGESGT
jgi:3-oxoadipate enol-lactonase